MSRARQPSGRGQRVGRDRPERRQPGAHQLAQRRVARRRSPAARRLGGGALDRRLRCGRRRDDSRRAAAARRSAATHRPRRTGRVDRHRAAVARAGVASCCEPASASRRCACGLAVGDDAERAQRLVHLVGVARAAARPRARTAVDRLGDRAGRGRRRSPGRRSGGSAPPACGAPRAARRRGRRRAARSAPRRRAATAPARSRATHLDRARFDAAQQRAASRRRPSPRARQSSSVCATSGWSGISRSPARFSAQATWSGKTAASRSSRLHPLQLRRDLACRRESAAARARWSRSSASARRTAARRAAPAPARRAPVAECR